MQKIIYICDKCGKQKSEDSTFLKMAYEYEICSECFRKFENYVNRFFAPAEVVPAEEKPKKQKIEKAVAVPSESKRKPIDWDKACALKVAGWSNKYIAEELGLNKPTIDAMIYKKVEAYKNGERFGKVEADDGCGEDY